MQNLIINGIIGAIELILCKGENKDNILKVAGESLIMIYFENCFEYKEIFNISYAILETLILPLLFWRDFISIEETKSKEILYDVIGGINIFGNEIIKKLEIIDKDTTHLIDIVLKAIEDLTFKLENQILWNLNCKDSSLFIVIQINNLFG